MIQAVVDHEPLHERYALIGKKWRIIILRRLATDGPIGFVALRESIPGISHKMLADSLDELVAGGLVTRTVQSMIPLRTTYELSTTGFDLEPALRVLEAWAKKGTP